MNKILLSFIFLCSVISTDTYANCYGEKQSKCNQEDAAKILLAAGIAVLVVRAMNRNDESRKFNIHSMNNLVMPLKESKFVINFDNPTLNYIDNFNSPKNHLRQTQYINLNLKYNLN